MDVDGNPHILQILDKTNKLEKDGLFCGRIFEPIKSEICVCENYRVIRDKKDNPKFCEQCGVEFIDSVDIKWDI